MKPLIFILSLIIANSTINAQCGKKIQLIGSETTYLDSNGKVKRTVTENSVLQINKSEVNLSVNDEHKTTCTIKSSACNWTVPFKQGKTTIKASYTEDNGTAKNVTIDIEGKDGKITLIFKMEDRPDNIIKVAINKFEEEG